MIRPSERSSIKALNKSGAIRYRLLSDQVSDSTSAVPGSGSSGPVSSLDGATSNPGRDAGGITTADGNTANFDSHSAGHQKSLSVQHKLGLETRVMGPVRLSPTAANLRQYLDQALQRADLSKSLRRDPKQERLEGQSQLAEVQTQSYRVPTTESKEPHGRDEAVPDTWYWSRMQPPPTNKNNISVPYVDKLDQTGNKIISADLNSVSAAALPRSISLASGATTPVSSPEIDANDRAGLLESWNVAVGFGGVLLFLLALYWVYRKSSCTRGERGGTADYRSAWIRAYTTGQPAWSTRSGNMVTASSNSCNASNGVPKVQRGGLLPNIIGTARDVEYQPL